ncbi:MAG: bifunctional glutamate N-acetyltransferase/amino-acid acetyltransferase ArgJ [Proteobacteria bacterium]|nr:bifunctional glutamate N-acetyltransferase/amino-acid acetyltransferase ArgJ [Pseudomonadota bacterium]
MKTAKGFTFSGVHAGLKPSRRDVALVASEVPCVAAGCFTTNAAAAAPFRDAQPRLPSSIIRAVLINSGNANALTGPAGIEDVRACRAAVGAALGVAAEAIVAASTGVIGMRLPAAKIVAAAPALVAGLTIAPHAAAEAIMTTDTRIKLAARTVTLGGHEVTLSAIAKGSGMIAPQLATAIAVITTDAAIAADVLDDALRAAMTTSFNSLVIDGDTSTNDCVFVLANGLAKNPAIVGPGPDRDAFAEALTALCEELAREIAADGEGATKQLEVVVTNCPSAVIATDLARSIAGSTLVKAAVFGADPNWGRVLATVGARAGSQRYPIDPHRCIVTICGVRVFADGAPAPFETAVLRSRMRDPNVTIVVDCAAGDARATAWGCDLSYDYVKINADYTSLIVQSADGQLAKDDRLTNYSPSLKRSLIVEALSYISKFAGKRCVIKYGGAAMLKDSLKKAFCDDIRLLRTVGLLPIIVHGGGPEIERMRERMGSSAQEFIDGVEVTSAADMKVMEMVLSGGINSELVTLLNLDGANAMGLSGKDGALLRAKKLHAEHGRDLGQAGEITSVNKDVLEMLLGRGFVPVISPIGLGDDGQSYHINADSVAAQIAIAVGAEKLIFLTNVAGILEDGELLGQLSASELARHLVGGSITGVMRVKAESALQALAGGVARVHVLDGRTPHTVIAELFTDRGVGTLVTSLEPGSSSNTKVGA